MAEVTVTPDEFNFVDFDADLIRSIAERLIDLIGVGSDTVLTIEVDETSPLGRSSIASLDPLVINVESGAFEDPKRPRQQSETGTADVLGRLLLKAADRLDGAFGAPDLDDEAELPYRVAWDVYAVGRLARLGYRAQRQRRLYHFRNRCGFTDTADEVFDEIWTGDGLTWADLVNKVDRALASKPEPVEIA